MNGSRASTVARTSSSAMAPTRICGESSWRRVVYILPTGVDSAGRPRSGDAMANSTDVFNAAAHFIDRHISEGRGASIAIECGERRITYAELYEQVNRTGAALRTALGVRPEERVL